MKEELIAFFDELGVGWRETSGGFWLEKPSLMVFSVGIDGCSLADLEKIAEVQHQGVRLISLWEDVWRRKGGLVRMRLAGEIGGRRRIFARNCTIETISKEEADAFFEATHLLGAARTKYRYGLFYQGALVAAAAFSGMRMMRRELSPHDKHHAQRKTHSPIEIQWHRSAEWIRYSSLPHITVTGGMSKLLSAFVAEHRPDDVMSYANKDWSEGAAYIKLGFKAAGETPIQSHWLDPHTLQRYPRKRHPLPLPHWIEVYSLGSLKFVKMFRNCFHL